MKPLHEMDLPEVLGILTPTQKNSVLAYARQLARNTLSPNPTWFVDGRVKKSNENVAKAASGTPALDSEKTKKQKNKRQRNRSDVNATANLKKPRIVQGGLCSPR